MEQNKKFTFEMSWQMVQIISFALHEAPISKRVADNLLMDLQKQMTEQTAENVVQMTPDSGA